MAPAEHDVDLPSAQGTTDAAASANPATAVATGGPVSQAPPTAPGRSAGAGGGRRPRPIFLVIGVVVAAALGVGLFTGIGTPSKTRRPVAGAQVPSFSLAKLGGSGKVGVPADGGGNGKPAVLLFFASWCVQCHSELPALASTYRRQQHDGSRLATVPIIGIDVLDPTSNALAFMNKSGVTFPVGNDKSSTVMNGIFQFTGLPDTVFVDANGTIAGIHQGSITTSELVSWQRRLLAST